LEHCYNLVAQVRPEDDKKIKYGSSQALLIARFIQDIMMNVNEHGASFAQQYICKKVLSIWKEKTQCIDEGNQSTK
jgi:hypothetical protein